MAPSAQDLLWTGLDYDLLIGSLAVDLFVAVTDTGIVTLYAPGAPSTTVDTVDLSAVWLFAGNVAENDSGCAGFTYFDTGGTTHLHLVHCAQSAGVLACTDTDLGVFAGDLVSACGDGSGYLFAYSTTVVKFLSTAGTQLWTDTFSGDLILSPRAARYVVQSGTTIYLKDSTGSVLDSITGTTAPSHRVWVHTGANRMTVLDYEYSSGIVTYRTLDTAGDVLSWVRAEDTIDVGWAGSSTAFPVYGSWAGQVAIVRTEIAG